MVHGCSGGNEKVPCQSAVECYDSSAQFCKARKFVFKPDTNGSLYKDK